LFGLVPAIGIVVDDAIVVVEAVEHNIEQGLEPKETHKAMDTVGGAVLAIAIVLSAVFIPTAFISGITGRFYRQFALTIAAATLISAFNSLTLSPALAGLLLKPKGAKKDLITALLLLSVVCFKPVRQKGKRLKGLIFGNLGHVMPGLFTSNVRITNLLLCFDDSENLTVGR
jgi:multidrug efflux pump